MPRTYGKYQKGDELEVRGKDGRYVETLNLTKARIANAAVDAERDHINGMVGWATGVVIELIEGELEGVSDALFGFADTNQEGSKDA